MGITERLRSIDGYMHGEGQASTGSKLLGGAGSQTAPDSLNEGFSASTEASRGCPPDPAFHTLGTDPIRPGSTPNGKGPDLYAFSPYHGPRHRPR